MSFGKFRRQLNCLAARRICRCQIFAGRMPIKIQIRGAVGEAGVGSSKLRIQFDRPCKHFSRSLEILTSELMEELPSFEVQLISMQVGCAWLFALPRTALVHPAVKLIFEREYAAQFVVHLPAYWDVLGSRPPLDRAATSRLK